MGKETMHFDKEQFKVLQGFVTTAMIIGVKNFNGDRIAGCDYTALEISLERLNLNDKQKEAMRKTISGLF